MICYILSRQNKNCWKKNIYIPVCQVPVFIQMIIEVPFFLSIKTNWRISLEMKFPWQHKIDTVAYTGDYKYLSSCYMSLSVPCLNWHTCTEDTVIIHLSQYCLGAKINVIIIATIIDTNAAATAINTALFQTHTAYVYFINLCHLYVHHPSPAEGVTLMASTPSGRAISWLYSLCVVRLRRQALCRLEVQGLLFWVTGELNVSKLNWEVFIGEAVVASFSIVVSSVGDTNRKREILLRKAETIWSNNTLRNNALDSLFTFQEL